MLSTQCSMITLIAAVLAGYLRRCVRFDRPGNQTPDDFTFKLCLESSLLPPKKPNHDENNFGKLWKIILRSTLVCLHLK